MKCVSCGSALQGAMKLCSCCGVPQVTDLRKLHFRDLSSEGANLPCPQCQLPLQVIEVATNPPVRIERCGKCLGMFFNPGELEAVLHQQAEVSVRLGSLTVRDASGGSGHRGEEFYLKCPMCSERMNHLNFGGKSGVILDRCGTHGVWLDGGELRRLAEWWRAGGKLIHQREEAARAGSLFIEPSKKSTESGSGSADHREGWSWARSADAGLGFVDIFDLLRMVGSVAKDIID